MFNNVDRNIWIKHAHSIGSYLVDFDLKNVDLVVNNKMNKNLGIFTNGILLYQRNRLIQRFDCELGDLLNALEF
jgi:hypothetical protein